MKTLIFFGSLRSIKLLQIVIGRNVEERSLNKGFIKNARLYQVKNETFPYIELNNDFPEKVECLVVNDLQNEDIDKIQFLRVQNINLKILIVKLTMKLKIINISNLYDLIKLKIHGIFMSGKKNLKTMIVSVQNYGWNYLMNISTIQKKQRYFGQKY